MSDLQGILSLNHEPVVHCNFNVQSTNQCKILYHIDDLMYLGKVVKWLVEVVVQCTWRFDYILL